MINPPPSTILEFSYEWKKWLSSLYSFMKKEYIATGEATLANGATTTTVTEIACKTTSRIALFPTTSDAASVVATTYISSKANGSFVITHTNAATSRIFDYILVNE